MKYIGSPKSSVAVDASLLSAEDFSMMFTFSFTGMFLSLECRSFFSVHIEKETQMGAPVHEAKINIQTYINIHIKT
jgi:hypothetical protein